ncbi:hypothetical protein IQB76_10730 [Leptospira borgpetersenii serovar Hardjo-bovis]|nr:hypothetical protein [Leptospira borgpetersenii]AMX57194.1 hypothetical protein LBK6_01915 [Leptospira borgpetersenii serovar Hardjo]AMX60425.1 hypothetical protein LBK9_01910 [Leptospira borgpetersenii serovar Hardjo]AMX63672.1 hypothetical protein LBK30_01930 [Leptospira borgpetersenii serovar Hardjo]AMX66911.1 hypothetical protein LBHA_01930 [Leptospira borgpetersenii serovar Hardjo]AWV69100.1 hypothetical protein B9T54_02060 [Leptospira borgpetersenii serovar Hardjo-bovis]
MVRTKTLILIRYSKDFRKKNFVLKNEVDFVLNRNFTPNKDRTMKQNLNNSRIRRFIYSVFLILFLFSSITAFDVYAQEDEKKTHSTKNIDITVKDKDGYNHFLVFTKVTTPDKSYIAYNVEFWVNNYVYSGGEEFSQISFKAGKKSLNGSYYKYDTSSGAIVLYFYMDETATKELLTNSGSVDKITISQKNKTVSEYILATKDNFKKALKEIMAAE